jgi:hypothetical protein
MPTSSKWYFSFTFSYENHACFFFPFIPRALPVLACRNFRWLLNFWKNLCTPVSEWKVVKQGCTSTLHNVLCLLVSEWLI